MFVVLLLFELSLLLLRLRGEVLIESSACRYLANLQQQPPTEGIRVGPVEFAYIEDLGGYQVDVTCENAAPTENVSWCLLFTNSSCTCLKQNSALDVYFSDKKLTWNFNNDSYYTYVGTMVACFVKSEEGGRLIYARFASGVTPRILTKDNWLISVLSILFGLIATLIFTLPCCLTSCYSSSGNCSLIKSEGKLKIVRHSTNIKWKSVYTLPSGKYNRINPTKGKFVDVWIAEIKHSSITRSGGNIACVKAFNQDRNHHYLSEYQNKVNLKLSLPFHKNIVNLLGVIDDNPHAYIVEWASYGTLHAFLQNKEYAMRTQSDSAWPRLDDGGRLHNRLARHQESTLNTSSASKSVFSNSLNSPLSNEDIKNFALQILEGLQYLGEKNRIVHRKLTTECIYIGECFTLKVGGFASQKVDESKINFTEFSQKRRMSEIEPKLTSKTACGRALAKWAPPEVILRLQYSLNSDIWSFGMTVWEIAAYGQVPFEDIPVQVLPTRISIGTRPACPDYLSTEVYKILQCCWRSQPRDRITFNDLADFFSGSRDVTEATALAVFESQNTLAPLLEDQEEDDDVF